MTAPEFSRRVALSRIGSEASEHPIIAEPEERAALATRFGLVSIDALDAVITLRRDGDAVSAEGRVTGKVVQSCVASGEPVAAAVEAPLLIRFVAESEAGDEIELDADACDELPHDGVSVDIGEAAAQTLMLALDPYPRAPGSDATLKAAGVIAEDEFASGPLAALGALFKK